MFTRRTAGPARLVAASLFLLVLAGCASRPIPLNYAPSSVLSAEGRVDVTAFEYLPAKGGEIKPNQVRNTAMGNILFEKNVDAIMRDAVFSELRLVGIKMDKEGNVLSGKVEEFLIDDLGYSVDWTLRVRYVVTDPQGQVVYDQVKNVQRNTSKFVNIFGSLNETIKLNIEQTIKDPAFITAIN
ncbi:MULTISPECIES: hypothetical protein [Stenotrophomonas]|mgnify:CR=1 FL=1|uniref:hypothetical protein n=1 Tax=Stenotrophomonas TaxID=40323 RepID=UPI000ECA3B0B|nr:MULTISPECIES: hypothetical protein [Stenotrophomonas]HAL21664.1 hypothetical protein [Stenotrophomonas sp.]